jgi:hypothetical protein
MPGQCRLQHTPGRRDARIVTAQVTLELEHVEAKWQNASCLFFRQPEGYTQVLVDVSVDSNDGKLQAAQIADEQRAGCRFAATTLAD